jgi:hypothetical protein
MADKPTTHEARVRIATQPKDVRKFYIKTGRIQVDLAGVQSMQQRDDISGKFARKCSQIARVLRQKLEELMEDEKALQEKHKRKFPEGHPRAGEVEPVYAIDEKTGDPVFKKDSAGNDTQEREIVQGAFSYVDPIKYQQERLEMLKEYVVVEVPCFLVVDPDNKDDKFVPELDRFGKVKGTAWDACADFEDGAPTMTPPAEWQEKPARPAETADSGSPGGIGSDIPENSAP